MQKNPLCFIKLCLGLGLICDVFFHGFARYNIHFLFSCYLLAKHTKLAATCEKDQGKVKNFYFLTFVSGIPDMTSSSAELQFNSRSPPSDYACAWRPVECHSFMRRHFLGYLLHKHFCFKPRRTCFKNKSHNYHLSCRLRTYKSYS
jgi:hypothetical protein